jgi:hypothetical protein
MKKCFALPAPAELEFTLTRRTEFVALHSVLLFGLGFWRRG